MEGGGVGRVAAAPPRRAAAAAALAPIPPREEEGHARGKGFRGGARTWMSRSDTSLQNLVPCAASISSAHALKASPGGESAPAPRNHGSTTEVSFAEGTSPSSICFA